MTTRRESVLLGFAIGKFVIADRVLGVVTRSVDASMLYFLLAFDTWGIPAALIVSGAWNFLLCGLIVWLCNTVLDRTGIDMSGLSDLRSWIDRSLARGGTLSQIARIRGLILTSRRTTFWVGSWFWLDPDFVTLLLQRRSDGLVRSLLKITLPSVVIAQTVWTGVYLLVLEVSGAKDWPALTWLIDD